MLRRFLIASACTFALLVGGSVPRGPSWITTVAAQKTVHVKGYTKKDGTVVQPYDRAAPKSKGDSGSTTKDPATTTKTAGTTTAAGTSPPQAATACKTCPRDADGKIARSGTQKSAFMKQTGFSNGRPGYVVDHIIPLACGGPDVKENMQWQTAAQAKAKDAWERRGCHN